MVTLLAAGIYVVRQQQIRSAANHPQTSLARHAVSLLNQGANVQAVVPTRQIDIGRSPDPYLIVVDGQGNLLATSAVLDGAPVIPPSGVFDYVRSHGEDVISWQPAAGVRSAIVVDSFSGGFVVAGRSLQPTEDMESQLGIWVVIGWLAVMAVIGGAALGRGRLRP